MFYLSMLMLIIIIIKEEINESFLIKEDYQNFIFKVKLKIRENLN